MFLMPSDTPPPTRTRLSRIVCGTPPFVSAVVIAVVMARYVSGEIRITAEVRSFASWPVYEFLAVVYSSLLPLAMTVAGLLGYFGLRLRSGKGRGLAGAVLLLLPIALFAWKVTPDVPGGGWMLLLFLWLALARFVSHRAHGTLFREGVIAFANCVKDGVRRYGIATGAFLLSAFFILPLEPIFGFEMPSVSHGQYYMMLGIGVIYFLIVSLGELLPFDQWLFRLHERHRKQAEAAPATETVPRQ